MEKMNKLQEALRNIELEAPEKYKDSLQAQETYKFSRRYLKRRRAIISMSENITTQSDDHTNAKAHSYHFRLRTVLVAALIMLLATLSVIAATKPHIYYVIKENLESWDITFSIESDEPVDSEFVALEPKLPDDYEITKEIKDEIGYFFTSKNQEGKFINYEQTLAEGLIIGIDSERSDNQVIIIDGSEVIVSKEANYTTVVFNDGKYVYQIDSNDDESVVFEMMDNVLSQVKTNDIN